MATPRDPDTRDRLDRFKAVCKEHGYSVTPQRLALYEALIASDSHPSPEALQKLVVGRLPSLSLATVYKAIDTFKALGLCQEVNALHDRKRLDANMAPHHHLVCVRCRRIVDIHDEELDGLSLPPESRRGFKLFEHAVQFNGLCPDCQRPR